MVQIGGIGSGMFLVAVVFATWYLRRQVDERFRGSLLVTAMLVLSSVLVAALGIYTALEVFGIEIG
jgi:hypothetical protein